MEHSSPHLKKFLIFSYIPGYGTFKLKLEKENKIHPGKISYISGNGNPKLISYIFSKESCFYISGNGNPKKFLIYKETETLKSFYNSRNGTFLYS